MNKTLLCFLALVILCGCGSSDVERRALKQRMSQFEKVQTGMTRKEVLELLGGPAHSAPGELWFETEVYGHCRYTLEVSFSDADIVTGTRLRHSTMAKR